VSGFRCGGCGERHEPGYDCPEAARVRLEVFAAIRSIYDGGRQWPSIFGPDDEEEPK
jgi:hypothetical protein